MKYSPHSPYWRINSRDCSASIIIQSRSEGVWLSQVTSLEPPEQTLYFYQVSNGDLGQIINTVARSSSYQTVELALYHSEILYILEKTVPDSFAKYDTRIEGPKGKLLSDEYYCIIPQRLISMEEFYQGKLSEQLVFAYIEDTGDQVFSRKLYEYVRSKKISGLSFYAPRYGG